MSEKRDVTALHIRHSWRTRANPMPTSDVALDPAYQVMLRRLLAHGICDTNSRVIDRVQVAVQVASVIRQKREARL